MREGDVYAQAEAIKTMVAAQMKTTFFEDHNMFLLMTMLDTQIKMQKM